MSENHYFTYGYSFLISEIHYFTDDYNFLMRNSNYIYFLRSFKDSVVYIFIAIAINLSLITLNGFYFLLDTPNSM
jgi:hypothetical protein